MTAALLAVLLFLTSAPARAQQPEQFQIWNAMLGTAPLSAAAPANKLWLDTHARRGDAGTTAIFRPGLGRQLAPWATAWAGYAWIPVWSDVAGTRADEQQHALALNLFVSPRWER